MSYVDIVLDEFRGQLSLNDIYSMTYKEIGYLRKHRQEINKRRQPKFNDINDELS